MLAGAAALSLAAWLITYLAYHVARVSRTWPYRSGFSYWRSWCIAEIADLNPPAFLSW